MRYTYMSDKGISRENNEDFILISEDLSLFLIADGMGGHSAGEVASEQACRVIMDRILSEKKEFKKDYKKIINRAIEDANSHLLKLSEVDENLNGMGTTIVLLHFNDGKYKITHIGDSRAYKFDGKNLLKLTKDHSLVQKMLDEGILSEEEAKNHKLRNVITASIGSPIDVNIEFVEGKIKKKEMLILCTDGLHDYVDMDEVAKILKEDGIDGIQKLIDLANSAGGNDNCSIICISN